MVVKDGKKYACDSCIRGHRVSGCTHTDRELHYIAPKGRPVKQCDHCRGARKSKSHHAKCDCGGRQERNEVKLDDKGCCCTLGDNCICGLKNGGDLRIDTALGRPSHVRPHLTKGSSEGHIATYINGHNKAVHKWEKDDQHGAPYPCRKALNGSSHCNTPSSIGSQQQFNETFKIPHRGSKDDSALLSSTSPSSFYSNTGQLSVDNLPLSTFSAGSLFATPNFFQGNQQQSWGLSSPDGQDETQFSPTDPATENLINEILATSNPSPVNGTYPQLTSTAGSYQGSQEDIFTSEHLPLMPLSSEAPSNLQACRTISNSDESLLHSGPGLTANSSTTPSEMGDVNAYLDSGLESISELNTRPTPVDMPSYGFSTSSVSPTQEIDQASPLGNAAMQNFGFDTTSMSPNQKMQQIPTSNPTENTRRSLDINKIRNLGLPPYDLDDETLENILNRSSISASNNNASANLSSSFGGTSGIPYDTQTASTANRSAFSQQSPNFIAPTSNPTTTSVGGSANRPRSMPIPLDFAYDPNTTINDMYPQLDQDFTAAAAWEPTSGLDFSSTGFNSYPMQ